MLKVKNSALATSAVKKSQYPEEKLPQIVLVGRSNVGKSSLINCLINRKNLARTSSAPGKTRLLNFYRIEGTDSNDIPRAWYFVDLPGYGYAKVAKTERANFLSIIENFLSEDQDEKYCWQLVDIRHAPSKEDIAMCDILIRAGYRLQIIVTKADKISRGARDKQITLIARELGVKREKIIPFSAETRDGKEQLLSLVEAFLAEQAGDIMF